MTSNAKYVQLVSELYWLMGHKVERITRRSNTTTDILIHSNRGEPWLIRFEYLRWSGQETLDRFRRTIQSQTVAKAALIVGGQFHPSVPWQVEDRNFYVLDVKLFQQYLRQARQLARQKAGPLGFALQRLAWKVGLRFVKRAFQPLPPDPEPVRPRAKGTSPTPRPSFIEQQPPTTRPWQQAPRPRPAVIELGPATTPVKPAPPPYQPAIRPSPPPGRVPPSRPTPAVDLKARLAEERLAALSKTANPAPRPVSIPYSSPPLRTLDGTPDFTDDSGGVISEQQYRDYHSR